MLPNQVLRSLSRSDILCILGMIACSLVGFAPITKYIHGPELALFAAAIALCVILAMLWLRFRRLYAAGDLKIWSLAIFWCAFALLFFILFPLASRHTLGPGSDRADALRISASALVHGHFPYRATTYLGNPITPLPGAIIFATPFFLLGKVSVQNLLWLALFLLFGAWYFRSRSSAIIYTLILLGASASNLDDFVVGGDFVVNAFYVCVAMALVIASHEQIRALWRPIAAAAFLGLAIDSRPIYIVVVPLLVAYVLQHRGWRSAIRLLLVSGAVALSLSLPFYLYDPAHFSPLHLRDKLDFFPNWFHAVWIVPALALPVSCSGFWIRLTRSRVFLLTGFSLLVMLDPPAMMAWFLAPFTLWAWLQLSLLSIPAIFLSLCILAKFEQSAHSFRPGTAVQQAAVPS